MNIVPFRSITLTSQRGRKATRRHKESIADCAERAELHRMLDEILNHRNNSQDGIRENVEYTIEVIRGGGSVRP